MTKDPSTWGNHVPLHKPHSTWDVSGLMKLIRLRSSRWSCTQWIVPCSRWPGHSTPARLPCSITDHCWSATVYFFAHHWCKRLMFGIRCSKSQPEWKLSMCSVIDAASPIFSIQPKQPPSPLSASFGLTIPLSDAHPSQPYPHLSSDPTSHTIELHRSILGM